ncbi:membrane protein insertase YidC [Akkermansia sp.]|uniref:membrane protein insertase YidC n=1 Tax=Akkermansia sp. TaxID=1872421 RepID=UPI0025C3E493|nr:membrane protein insertase YidC [Akkermansia sp.]MCC8148994.1 membrane protein insertase YidC [Akkermansia sp.]
MDRTAWIIIGVCAALLGLNIYMGNNKKAEPVPAAPVPAQQTAAAPANAPATGATTPASPATPEQPSVNKALEEDKTSPITLVATQEVDGKQVPFITYTFNRIGGSIGTVTLHNDIVDSQKVADRNITINEAQKRGIGELVFNMDATQDPTYDNTVYKEVKRTADSVTLEGYDTARQLFISKTYTLHPVRNLEGKVLPGSKYMVRLTVSLLNKSPNVQDLRYMGIFGGSAYPIAKSEPKDTYTHFFYHANGSLEQEVPSYFTGGIFSSAKARVLEGPLQDLTYAGVMSQYYATILLPQDQSNGSTVYATRQEFPLEHENNTLVPGVTVAMGIPNLTMAPNEIKTLTYDIYTGPKFNAYLRDLNLTYPAISDIMAYGWLVFLSVPMNWLLNLFHGWFGNWGVAIICMTIVVRALIWPLHKKSYMAMKRMSLVQPEMAKLKEKYPDDAQKVNMEMMKLYQKYGINPASGCVPMLIQIPIFFAFYRVLQYSAELRGQPFCLWMTDLSLPDTVGHLFGIPINILPLIMAVTMIVQMRMTPQAGERSQRIIMNLMPLMFFLFCYNFASALALYWTTQNLISIGQTALIRRLPMPVLSASKKKKPGFFQRMMDQQRIALEEQQRKAKGHNMRNVTPKK